MTPAHGTANRNVLFISFSQLAAATSFNFVYIFLPFYVAQFSPYGVRATVLWTGIIMGVPGIFMAAIAPWFGSLAHRFPPRTVYLGGLMVNTVTMLLMAFTPNIPGLLSLRIIAGLAGGISTIGLIITSICSTNENRAHHVGIFQSAISMGFLLGPFLGSLTVAAVGFKGAFISAASIIFFSFICCSLAVADVPPLASKAESTLKALLHRRVVAGIAICAASSIHQVFAPCILPNIFARYGFSPDIALRWAGTLVMLYTIAALVGTYSWSWLSKNVGERRLIFFLAVSAAVAVCLLVFASGIIQFTVLMMVQTGLAAGIIPITIAFFAKDGKGSVIGFLNAGRFAGSAVAPLLATSVFAYANLPAVYLSVAIITLGSLMFFRRFA